MTTMSTTTTAIAEMTTESALRVLNRALQLLFATMSLIVAFFLVSSSSPALAERTQPNDTVITAHASASAQAYRSAPKDTGDRRLGVRPNASVHPNASVFQQSVQHPTWIKDATPTDEVIQLINIERQKAGIAPLQPDASLVAAADIRVQEAARSFSHTRPDGSMWKTVFSDLAIDASARGENLAFGQKTPQMVVRAWMNSPLHRQNILNSNFNRIAVSRYQKNGTVYWSQLFMQSPHEILPADDQRQVILVGAPVICGRYAQVIDQNLKVRTTGSARASVVAVADQGSKLSIMEIVRGWAHVKMSDGTQGWASMKYLMG